MAEYQPLTDSEVRDTATAYFTERQSKASNQEHPTIVLVGGQPGAGKSAAAAVVKSDLSMRGGYIHVDADRMRERIRVGDSKPTSEQTQADAGRLVTTLRDQAIQSRRNIVEEGTFRSPEGAGKFVRGLQERGYKVELFAVATPREESLLGIYQRHELQHAAGGANPRFVSEKYHDEAMQGFESTLARAAAQLDRVRVADRSGAVLYDSVIQGNQHRNALEALATGRKLTDTKLAEVTNAWDAVETAARQRNAPGPYLEAVISHARRVKDMRNERFGSRGADKDDFSQLSPSEQSVLDNSRVFLKSQGFSPQSSDAILKELDAKLRLERPMKNRDGGDPGKSPASRVYDLKADRPTPASKTKNSPGKSQDQSPTDKSPDRDR